MPIALTFFWGFLFSIGVAVSGMTQPTKVVGFLNFLGDWDPSLVLVMGGAVTTYFILSRFTLKRDKPITGEKFQLPTRVDIDGRLIAGAALFGIGWGMGGYCPGPALASLVTLDTNIMIFVLSMSMGMYVYGTLDSRFTSEPDGGAGALEPPVIAIRQGI